MTTGIYKITNKINQHCYIGLSTQIEERWKAHRAEPFNPNSNAYNYPLYRAMRKYGLDNFSFEIIEQCSRAELSDREIYWIAFYHAEYNQTLGGENASIPQKLTLDQVAEIQQILINDTTGMISHKELAKQFNVHKDTIRDINVGRTWYKEELNYPLHYSKFDAKKPYKIQKNKYCIDCGTIISHQANRCAKCYSLLQRVAIRPTREELKQLIRTTPFTTIGKKYNVTDNSIRKWCKTYQLPSKAKDIKSYSDEEWDKI